MHPRKLLTTRSPKASRGLKYGYHNAILHLSPLRLAGRENVCPYASKGCARACLNTSGRAGIFKKGKRTNIIQKARIRRTRLFFDDRQGFFHYLVEAIGYHNRYARRRDLKPCFRLNGTSDIAWELEYFKRGAHEHANIFRAWPEIQFYDYTKSYKRMTEFLGGKMPRNYHLTFSRSETNDRECRKVLRYGGNVAVVYRGSLEILQQKYGARAVDGDLHDLTFLHDRGVIVALTPKGKAKNDCTGFVIDA